MKGKLKSLVLVSSCLISLASCKNELSSSNTSSNNTSFKDKSSNVETSFKDVTSNSSTSSNDVIPKDGNIYVDENISTTEKIKLLLANDRLDKDAIKFENFFANNEEDVNSDKIKKKNFKKSAKKEGDKYVWDDLDQSYSDLQIHLESALINCEQIVQNTSHLIDYIKEEVRVTDKWVDKYLLQVDQNSETLYFLEDNILTITKRTINEEGHTQYDTYQKSLNYEGYNFYSFIPGVTYKCVNASDIAASYLIINEKNDAYEIFNWTTYINEKYLGSGTVGIIGQDKGYYSYYSIDEVKLTNEKEERYKEIIITDDKKGDYLKYAPGLVTVGISGLSGVQSIKADASSVEHYFDDYYNGWGEGSIYLENGKVLNTGDTFVDGKVGLESFFTSFVPYYDSYYGDFSLRLEASTPEESIELLNSFYEEVGITPKQAIETTKDEIVFAYDNVDNFINYYEWDGNKINDEDSVKNAIDGYYEIVETFHGYYESVKDNEKVTIDENVGDTIIKFAPITNYNVTQVSSNENIISINGLSLTIDDVSLLEEGKQYNLGFALAKITDDKYSELVHIEVENIEKITYENSTSFTVSATADLFIHELDKGEYVLVSFIQNEEGLRFTEPVAILFENLNSEASLFNYKVSIASDPNKGIIVTYTDLPVINYVYSGNYNYKELVNELKTEAYQHGQIIGELEMLNGTEWIILDAGAEIVSGEYRVRFENESEVGHIVTTLN